MHIIATPRITPRITPRTTSRAKITKQINEVIVLEKINAVTTQKQSRNACTHTHTCKLTTQITEYSLVS